MILDKLFLNRQNGYWWKAVLLTWFMRGGSHLSSTHPSFFCIVRARIKFFKVFVLKYFIDWWWEEKISNSNLYHNSSMIFMTWFLFFDRMRICCLFHTNYNIRLLYHKILLKKYIFVTSQFKVHAQLKDTFFSTWPQNSQFAMFGIKLGLKTAEKGVFNKIWDSSN